MGRWGTGLYTDDLACDVRGAFREVVKLPLAPDMLGARVIARFGMGADPMAGEEVDFWLALADQFHDYGLDAPEIVATARRIIKSGADLSTKRDLGMEPQDLKKRALVLDALQEKWSQPHPKPRKRSVIKGPEPFFLEIGACVAYPTMSGWALPYGRHNFDLKTANATFRPDSWGAFVVLDRWLYEGFYARYLIAVAHLRQAGKPTLNQVQTAPVDGAIIPGQDLHLETLASCYMKSPKRELKLLQAEHLGKLQIDLAAVRQAALVLRKGMNGSKIGDSGLGNMLCLRKPNGIFDDTVHLPCPHLAIADFAK